MAYLRFGTPYKWFKGESKVYVYLHVDDYVEDYNEKYEDSRDLVELMGLMVIKETGDLNYATKVVYLLAAKLNITFLLQDWVNHIGQQKWELKK